MKWDNKGEDLTEVEIGSVLLVSSNEVNAREARTPVRNTQISSSQNYRSFLQDLRRRQIITTSQRRDMEAYVGREVQKAQQEAINAYMVMLGKEEELATFLQSRESELESNERQESEADMNDAVSKDSETVSQMRNA